MSKPLKTSPKKSTQSRFGPYQAFIDDFQKYCADIARQDGYYPPSALTKLVRDHAHIKEPFNEETIQEILRYVPKGARSDKFSAPLRWVRDAEIYSHSNDQNQSSPHNNPYLEALQFLFERGLSPASFVKQAYVSILGLAAYTGSISSLNLCYKHETKENCRLVLTEAVLSPNHPEIGSTLLHRLLDRIGGHSSPEICKSILVIIQNDPESVLQRKKDGMYPDECGESEEYQERCRALRAQLDKVALSEEIMDVIKTKKKTMKPSAKKMI